MRCGREWEKECSGDKEGASDGICRALIWPLGTVLSTLQALSHLTCSLVASCSRCNYPFLEEIQGLSDLPQAIHSGSGRAVSHTYLSQSPVLKGGVEGVTEAGRGEVAWKRFYFPRSKREAEVPGNFPSREPPPTPASKHSQGRQAVEQSYLKAPNQRPTVRQMEHWLMCPEGLILHPL